MHLEAEDKEATCKEAGYTVWQCECGAKEQRVVQKTNEHDYEGQGYVSDGAGGHHQVCKVCGEASKTVAHSLVDGDTITEPTFWTAGSKNVTCEHCDYSGTQTIARLKTVNNAEGFDASNTETGDWSYGKIEINNFDNILADNNTLTQATDKNGGGDGWTIDGKEVKAGWMSGSCIYVSYTVKEAVTLKVEVEVKRTSHMEGETKVDNKRFDVRTQIDGDSGARYHGGYDDNGVMKFTEEYTLEAGETLYMVFTSKGEDSGYEQADYSIKISRTEQVSD